MRKYRPFELAREFARSLKLRNGNEWREFAKSNQRPQDIPADPKRAYKNEGWKGVGDWLGTGNVANQDKEFRSFKEARAFARALKLKSQEEWREFAKSDLRPSDIPSAPGLTYKDKGWKGTKDWLGTD